MSIAINFLRIDDRLIHGQVLVGWLPILKSKQVLVANDKVAGDPLRQEMMNISIPQGVSLVFKPPSEIARINVIPKDTLVLVSSPKDAWLCLQGGLLPETLNIGGMHAKPGKREIQEALHIDEEDNEYLEMIIKFGIIPVFQPTPQNDPMPLTEIL